MKNSELNYEKGGGVDVVGVGKGIKRRQTEREI
jgi:hypothetical protein